MRAFSYAYLLPITSRRWRSHHSIRRSGWDTTRHTNRFKLSQATRNSQYVSVSGAIWRLHVKTNEIIQADQRRMRAVTRGHFRSRDKDGMHPDNRCDADKMCVAFPWC